MGNHALHSLPPEELLDEGRLTALELPLLLHSAPPAMQHRELHKTSGLSALPKQHWRGKGRGHGSWCGGEPYYSKEGNAYSGGYKDAAQFEEDLSCHRGGDRLGATLLKPKLAKKK